MSNINYSNEFKLEVINYYYETKQTLQEVADHFGLKSGAPLVRWWLKRYKNIDELKIDDACFEKFNLLKDKIQEKDLLIQKFKKQIEELEDNIKELKTKAKYATQLQTKQISKLEKDNADIKLRYIAQKIKAEALEKSMKCYSNSRTTKEQASKTKN